MEKKTKIVHLDDHRLYLDGVRKSVHPKFPDIKFIRFENTDEAFYYVTNCILKNQKIDLLITDFNHPGLNGYEFAKAVRSIERSHGKGQMPILLLTMAPKETPIISKALEDGIFNDYLDKEADGDTIAKHILKLL